MAYVRSPEGTVFETEHPEHHKDCERLSNRAGKAARRDYCIAELRELILPGDTVYTILRHVSSSGMSRRISALVIATDSDGRVYPRIVDTLVADAIQARAGDKAGVVMKGCGMDMGFDLVYRLSGALFPDGFDCVGKGCPSNDHSNGDRDYSPHRHTSGGYALRHSWL